MREKLQKLFKTDYFCFFSSLHSQFCWDKFSKLPEIRHRTSVVRFDLSRHSRNYSTRSPKLKIENSATSRILSLRNRTRECCNRWRFVRDARCIHVGGKGACIHACNADAPRTSALTRANLTVQRLHAAIGWSFRCEGISGGSDNARTTIATRVILNLSHPVENLSDPVVSTSLYRLRARCIDIFVSL